MPSDRLAETETDDDAPSDTPPARSDESTLERGAQLGRYIVLEPLGQGGMGVVYAAYDPELDRKIAIKLLREDTSPGSKADRRARLRREAQALARLGHPNIVAVYDVGTIGEQLFVAMELVDGRTVTAWLAESPQRWRDIVHVYREAGRGLAAAHALGIVHRDFKPDNVLIDRSGRVRVVDFGLAAAADSAGDGAPPEQWHATAELATPLTRTGAMLGTPGYIAPEGGATPAFDQFSFCAAVWKSVHGQLPFAGDSAAELAASAAKGELRPPARRVPARLSRVLRRGLSPDPAQRFASMDELLAALGRDRRRVYALAAAAVAPVVVVGAVAFVHAGGPSALCTGADRELAGAYDAQAIARAFAATNLPYATVAATKVAGALDSYSHDWIAMRTDACVATRVRGEQSDEVLDLRVACLDDRARELRALGELFAHADTSTVEKSLQAAQSLTPIADCAETAALKAPVRLPDSPVIRARIEGLSGEVAEARVLDNAGKYKDAIARLSLIVPQAHALGYRPLEASALRALGGARAHADQLPEAQATLEDAVNAAIAARDEATAADAATELVRIIGFDRAKIEEAQKWIARTQAFLEAHPDDRLRSQLDNGIGNVLMEAGKYDDSLAAHNRALAAREKLYGKDSLLVAAVLDNIGNDYLMKDEPAKSSDFHRRALELEIAALGPDHPRVALTLTNLGGSLYDEGKIDESLAAEQRALAIKEASYGKDSPMVAATLHEIANVYLYQARYADAEAAYRRVEAIEAKQLGPDHPRVGNAISSLANAVRHQHRLDEAEQLYHQALAILTKALGPDHHNLASNYVGLSQIAHERKQWDAAIANAQKAVDIYTKSGSNVAEPLTHVGDGYLGAGRFAQAIDAYQRSLAAGKDAEPVDRADTQFGLAQALWQTGDRAKARQLSDEADHAARAAGAHGKELHDAIAAWQTAHPAAP